MSKSLRADDTAFDALKSKLNEMQQFFGTPKPHTQEDLKRFQKELEPLKEQALKESVTYQRMMLEKRRIADERARKMEQEHRMKMLETKAEAMNIRTGSVGGNTEKIVTQRQARAIMDLKNSNLPSRKKTKTLGLQCPKCGDTNVSNTMVQGRGKKKKRIPYCFKCSLKLTEGGKGVRVLSDIENRENIRETLYRRD